jgi:hypothetical protein
LTNCTFPTLNQNTTGTASNVTGTVAIINGGTGETTRQAAMDALAGATTSGQYLRGNGTDVVMSAIQAADVPTLNQNTTGNAATATNVAYSGLTGTVPTWNQNTTGSSASCTGNAATATILQTTRTIGGVSFNGSANINLPGVNTSGNQNTTGNAATATTATSLNSSNFISQKGSAGAWNSDFQNTPAGTTTYNGDVGANTTQNPGGTWWMQQNFRHTNSGDFWGTQVAWGWEDNANRLATRNVSANTFGAWVYYLNSANYTSYAPSLTGSGASGTWGINVTGTATALSTASGSAPSYSARAWIRFNGTGTPAIIGSGNISSITDNGTGNYRLNFTTSLPDANFTIVGSAKRDDNATFSGNNRCFAPYGSLSSSASLLTIEANAGSAQDCAVVTASIYR